MDDLLVVAGIEPDAGDVARGERVGTRTQADADRVSMMVGVAAHG